MSREGWHRCGPKRPFSSLQAMPHLTEWETGVQRGGARSPSTHRPACRLWEVRAVNPVSGCVRGDSSSGAGVHLPAAQFPFWLHPAEAEAPESVPRAEAETRGQRPPAEAEDAPPALHPGKRAAYFISLGLGWRGRRGAWVPGLRGLGGAGRGFRGGQSPVPACPGGAAAPGAGRDHRERGRMRDAGCSCRGQSQRGKKAWCHGNSQWRPQGGDQRRQRDVAPPGGFRDCVCKGG